MLPKKILEAKCFKDLFCWNDLLAHPPSSSRRERSPDRSVSWHPERARRASRRISAARRGCTFLLLVQKKGTKENDTREGNCGLALPVAGEARPQFPQPRHKVNCRTAAIHLAVPEKCCGLTLFLAFFDRCGKGTSPSSATGGGLVPFPLPGPTLIETTKRGLRAPFGFPRDSPGNDSRFE